MANTIHSTTVLAELVEGTNSGFGKTNYPFPLIVIFLVDSVINLLQNGSQGRESTVKLARLVQSTDNLFNLCI